MAKSDEYIKRQEKFYKKPLTQINKFLIRDFERYIQNTPQVKVSEVLNTRKIKRSKPVEGKLQVAFITEDVGHLTGGRYYCWFIASALMSLGYDVTVYTNREPVFLDYFRKYQQLKIRVVAEKSRDLQNIDVEADIYLGSPISGNIASARLGEKYNKPAYAVIFDPFPMMNKYLGEKTYPRWMPLIKALRSTDTKIIALCESTAEYIYDWLNKKPGDVISVNPCINSRELNTEPVDRGDYVLFISRLVRYKNFDHVLQACKNLNIPLRVVASVDGIQAKKMVREMKMEDLVTFDMRVDDQEKFRLIKGARAVVNASIFEGFGMWFAEAITCGTPTVCYDYPTIKEIRDKYDIKNVYMAEWNNPRSLEEKLKQAYEDQKYTEPSSQFYFERLRQDIQDIFTIQPNIGVITIALNEEKFIQSSLRSVIKHPNVRKVAVVEGAVHLFPRSNEKGLSVDDTAEKIRKVQTEKNGDKIIYERYGYAKDKSELRNRALLLLGKGITHVLVVDGDEVYKQEDLDNLVQAMRDNPKAGAFLYPFYHFWKTKDQIAVGGQWDSQMFRCFKYSDKTLHWKRHDLPVVDNKNVFINVSDGVVELDNVHVYHYGYMKNKEDVQAKLNYYKKRDGHVLNIKDTWTNWKEGDATQPTHGGGTVKKFIGVHPPEIK